MLVKLIIRNYAIIDNLEFVPDAHLNTITGETGAGKSIILGAFSLILGDRADTSVLINKEEKCLVEAHFNVAGNEIFRTTLQKVDIDHEDVCIIRREISTSGKSRAFVNDTPVTLNTLNTLTTLLVDLHQQFGHLAFEDDHFKIDIVDAIAQNQAEKTAYATVHAEHRKIALQLADCSSKQTQSQKEADYKQFLLDELLQTDFKNEEIEYAALQMKQMSSAEKITGVLQMGIQLLEEGEQPLTNELKRIGQQLQSITDVLPEVSPLQERLTSVWAELKDIAAEFEQLEKQVSIDQQAMTLLQERLDLGYKMLKKHGLQTTQQLIALKDELTEELKATTDLGNLAETLAKEEARTRTRMMAEAEKLSNGRHNSSPQIVGKMNELLPLVGMPNAKFDIKIKQQKPGVMGMDDIQFLLDANKSGQFQPLEKAASGGEMSRIMLCIKSLTAKAMQLPTLIFDEVDTGISGEAARQVGVLLRDLSKYHQVICITHQPQVAARGSRHFYVYKDENKDGRINTRIRILKTDERILAIAQMIGGEQPSEAALQNARELVTI
jgi:DNA repair protein RecN (Recombination protein N)